MHSGWSRRSRKPHWQHRLAPAFKLRGTGTRFRNAANARVLLFLFHTTVHGLTSQTSHAPLVSMQEAWGPPCSGALPRNHSTALVFPPCTARHKPARRHDTDGTAQYGTERLCLSLAFERQLGSQFPSPPVMEGLRSGTSSGQCLTSTDSVKRLAKASSSSPCSSQLSEQRRNLCPGAQIVQHEESLGLLRARRLGLRRANRQSAHRIGHSLLTSSQVPPRRWPTTAFSTKAACHLARRLRPVWARQRTVFIRRV